MTFSAIRSDVRRLRSNAFTSGAKKSAWSIGLCVSDMREIVSGLQRAHFYKSMTTYDDHRVWQDVYLTQSRGLELYIRVTYRPSGGPPVISFKENNS